MIRMESPSFAFNSVDVPGPNYRMWETWNGSEGLTAAQLVDKILAVNGLAWEQEQMPLKNIIINSHGRDSGLGISIGGRGLVGIDTGTVLEFQRLRGKRIGTLWLVACQAAANPFGKPFCQALSVNSGCQVVAGEDNQETGFWGTYRLATTPQWHYIDEFEGIVYAFTANGGPWRAINPHEDILTIMD